METATMAYIEDYFEHTMPENERTIFEERINADKEFAKEVAFYVSARQALRQQLLQQKQKEWIGDDQQQPELAPVIPMAPVKKVGVSKWWSYVAAACVLLFVAFYFFERRESPQQMASNYISNNFSSLSNTMDGAKDSMGLGVTEYNKKNYDKALQYFEGVKNAHPENINAKKFTGIVYLFTGNFDKALQAFDDWANMKDLSVNAGLFFKATTLIQRNKEGDLTTAKQLLQRIVNENLANKKEAEDWLKRL